MKLTARKMIVNCCELKSALMELNVSGWLIKYKVPYILAWQLVSFIMLFISYDYRAPLLPQWLGYLVVTGLAVPICWYTANKLVPRYLYHRKIGRFISYLILLAAANALVTYAIADVTYHLLSGAPLIRPVYYLFTLMFGMLLIDIVLMAVSCIIKIIGDRYFMEQQMLQIEKEKISTELNFLRSQVNPHFLFNVMNTIYFQIDKTNTDARQSVEKFSEMLRYQLYECTTDKIQIQRELHYIRNYIAIQILRMEKDSDIQLIIEPDIGNFVIAPLLILPLVENAFKHVSTDKDSGTSKIHLTVKKYSENTLLVEVVNTYDQLASEKHLLQSGGLGIQNLKRRLELLYPGRYELAIDKQEHSFKTTLKLQYDD